MPFPAALFNPRYTQQLQQSSTGSVQIDRHQYRMSSSMLRPSDEIVVPWNPVSNYARIVDVGSRTVASFSPASAGSPFLARTPLGKKLVEIRQRAIASGLHLLTEEEIRLEIEQRRGENKG
jgi:hypothetical protein